MGLRFAMAGEGKSESDVRIAAMVKWNRNEGLSNGV